LLWGCTGDGEPNSQVLSACERYCALRDFCSQRSATCESECGWLDEKSNELHPACAEAQLLDCALSETQRIACAADSLTIDLTACPEHEPGSSCAVGFPPAQGAFQVALEDPEGGTCSLAGSIGEVGAADSPQGAQADGLQAFLKQVGQEQAVIPDLFVRCSLTETDAGFEVALALRAGSQGLELVGEVASSGSGTAAVSYVHTADSATLQSAAEAPCSIDVRPRSSGSLALSAGFIWADIQCLDKPTCVTRSSSATPARQVQRSG
jgi:hypothetical protein